MKQVVIENPIINSPFDEPSSHFLFSDEGITDEIVTERRTGSYFVPIAKPKTKSPLPFVDAIASEITGYEILEPNVRTPS